MDTDGRRRLFQEYGYRREKEIISRIWIQKGEGDYSQNKDTDGRRRLFQEYGYRRDRDYFKNMDTTIDGDYFKNMDTEGRRRLFQE